MLGFLFRGLTATPARGALLFAALVERARQPHWYIEGKVPDTLDGRFSVLVTLAALALVRLESEGEIGNPISVTLTERFIEVMESEHREMGIGDPTLGKTVRKLVGMLGRRVELWRSATAGGMAWAGAALDSVYRTGADSGGLQHSATELERFWTCLRRTPLEGLEKGEIA